MTKSARDRTEKVRIEAILAKPGHKWSRAERAQLACWLAREWRGRYLMIGLASLGNVKDAEDAFQEFCLSKIEKGFPSFDPQGNPHSFFLGAWKAHLTNYSRRRGRRSRWERQMPHDEEGNSLVEPTDREPPIPTLVDLEQRLECLSDDQRRVILERHYNGQGKLRPFREIASAMGRKCDAVRKIYERGLDSLKKRPDDGNRAIAIADTCPRDD